MLHIAWPSQDDEWKRSGWFIYNSSLVRIWLQQKWQHGIVQWMGINNYHLRQTIANHQSSVLMEWQRNTPSPMDTKQQSTQSRQKSISAFHPWMLIRLRQRHIIILTTTTSNPSNHFILELPLQQTYNTLPLNEEKKLKAGRTLKNIGQSRKEHLLCAQLSLAGRYENSVHHTFMYLSRRVSDADWYWNVIIESKKAETLKVLEYLTRRKISY